MLCLKVCCEVEDEAVSRYSSRRSKTFGSALMKSVWYVCMFLIGVV